MFGPPLRGEARQLLQCTLPIAALDFHRAHVYSRARMNGTIRGNRPAPAQTTATRRQIRVQAVRTPGSRRWYSSSSGRVSMAPPSPVGDMMRKKRLNVPMSPKVPVLAAVKLAVKALQLSSINRGRGVCKMIAGRPTQQDYQGYSPHHSRCAAVSAARARLTSMLAISSSSRNRSLRPC